MLKSKIQRATLTDANLLAEDCIILDRDLMKRADLWPFERVEIYNSENGARFTTSVIEGASGSGMVCVCGPAAHLAKLGHKITIASFITMTEAHLSAYRPKLVALDERNRPV